MITVASAKQIIAENTLRLPGVKVALRDALQRRLAEDVFSPANVPAYAQSGMDGYAFAYADWKANKTLPVAGEMAAGNSRQFLLAPGHAARIFTGAPLPQGADTVVMQEKTAVADNQLTILDEQLLAGTNVRAEGSAIRAGELALPHNTLLTPGAIGFLAGMGIHEVKVYPAPSVAIIVTGNELQTPGQPLAFGQVYESNSFAIEGLLQQLQIRKTRIYHAADELPVLQKILQAALEENDMVLLTGGVSVGDYDFVVAAASACGVQQLFHRIQQRPGKPLYFGKKENKLVFGLPGNPSSVLTCMYEYVLPGLQVTLPVLEVALEQDVEKPAALTCFLKGWYNGKTVAPLNAQESYRMSSFAVANCLIQLEAGNSSCKKDSVVSIHLLQF
ncbi:MAG TPA: molybdopterin molybdotransferase MoeA [Chitinophagaceae bacterium]|nr:molybdopterin molybdotransferase MoeA [Chitinophagaceae bacterium]